MKTIFALIVATSISTPSWSVPEDNQDYLQTGRYSYLKNTPLVNQLNPLKVVVKTSFPQSIETVGEAVQFLLVRSGYQLANLNMIGAEAQELLLLSLPQVHREIGPVTLDRALSMLGGSAFELVVDPIHRKVAYELSDNLAGL